VPTHAEKRLVPWTPEQMFDLVARVDRYPEFLPWCIAARVTSRTESELVADLVIGFKMLRERFTSRVTLERPQRLHVAYVNGPFRYLNNHWTFTAVPPSARLPDGGTEIDFYVDFEFRSKVLQSLIGVLFNEAVRRMVAAFETRARAQYGGASEVGPGSSSGAAQTGLGG
jgi:coenzyme Q-binding protein COQ10